MKESKKQLGQEQISLLAQLRGHGSCETIQGIPDREVLAMEIQAKPPSSA